MKMLFLVPCVLFAFSAVAPAGELYICTDRHGVKTIASVPQKGMKCKREETFREPTPAEKDQREEAKKQSALAEKAKKAQDDCYEQVRSKHKEAVNAYCTSRKLPPDCVVPPEDIAKLDKYIQEANDRCARLSVQ
jgi:hypothetical protein